MMHFRLQNGGRPCSPDCRLYIQLGGKGSPGFDTKFVVYSYSQPLLAADIAFCGLHRYMPEEKLDLLKLASRIVAERGPFLELGVSSSPEIEGSDDEKQN